MEYNKTTQVIIPISEYNELLEIKKDFVKAFEDNSILMSHRSFFTGPSGYPVHEYRIVNATDAIKNLDNEHKKWIEYYNKLYDEFRDFRIKEGGKKWYQFIPVK